MLPDSPSIPLGTHMMTYDPSAEPKFDPKIHVELVAPKNIAIFDEDQQKSSRASHLENINAFQVAWDVISPILMLSNSFPLKDLELPGKFSLL